MLSNDNDIKIMLTVNIYITTIIAIRIEKKNNNLIIVLLKSFTLT